MLETGKELALACQINRERKNLHGEKMDSVEGSQCEIRSSSRLAVQCSGVQVWHPQASIRLYLFRTLPFQLYEVNVLSILPVQSELTFKSI